MFAFAEDLIPLRDDDAKNRPDRNRPETWNDGETPLSLVRPGGSVAIARIAGKDELRRRLGSLGFMTGERAVVTTRLKDSLIVEVKESRIALSAVAAHRILVKPENP